MKKRKVVEIGILNRATEEVLTTCVEVDIEEKTYCSFGYGTNEEGEQTNVVYAFESNVSLLVLAMKASDATLSREFLKKYKLLKPNAVERYRKEGKITHERDPFGVFSDTKVYRFV